MEILNEIVNNVVPVAVTCVSGFLVKIAYCVGDIAIEYIKEKISESSIGKLIKENEYNLTIAKSIWNVVEENYRIADKATQAITSKADEFDVLLLKKIPSLTAEEIAELRQAIAGEFNKGKEVVVNAIEESVENATNTTEQATVETVTEPVVVTEPVTTTPVETVVNATEQTTIQA